MITMHEVDEMATVTVRCPGVITAALIRQARGEQAFAFSEPVRRSRLELVVDADDECPPTARVPYMTPAQLVASSRGVQP